jgi:hypothetical protein
MRTTLDECKAYIADYIQAELAEGTRKANIEIELIHFINRQLYGEANT